MQIHSIARAVALAIQTNAVVAADTEAKVSMNGQTQAPGLPRLTQVRRRVGQTALGLAALMIPASVAAYALGFWRVASDLNLTGEFPISKGLFSHWQFWVALGVASRVTP